MRAKNPAGDIPDAVGTHCISLFDTNSGVDEFKRECLRELAELADIHGILVLSLEIMDRELAGSLGKELEKRAEEVLQTQIKASLVEVENKIKTEEQKGILQVEQVHADVVKAKADGLFYQTSRAAEAEASASALKTEQVREAFLIISGG